MIRIDEGSWSMLKKTNGQDYSQIGHNSQTELANIIQQYGATLAVRAWVEEGWRSGPTNPFYLNF